MSEQTIQPTLAKLRCLEGVDEADLERLAAISKLVEFAPSALVFREGDPATTTYLVVEGAISLEICAPGVGCRRILTVGPGDMLGWSPVLQGDRLTATARAMSPTSVVEIPGQQVRDLCETSPRFGYKFMTSVAATLARRLSAARMQLLDVYGDEATGPSPLAEVKE